MAQLRDEKSLGDLFSDLAQDTSSLVRQEVQLAKTELTQSASEIGKAVGFMVVAGAIAYAGFLAILAAIILGLWDAGMEGWVAALIVGVVVIAISIILIQRARSMMQASNLAPRRTVASLKEDTEWVKEQMP
ncbi:MAG: phage holin family protein [Chloroflexia bacterium]|nr:phage holin family protein [Chloroflexia bacterium]